MYLLIAWFASFVAIKAAAEIILVTYSSSGVTIVAAAAMAFVVVLLSIPAGGLSQGPAIRLSQQRPHPALAAYFFSTLHFLLLAVVISTALSLVIIMAFSDTAWDRLFRPRYFVSSTALLAAVVAIPQTCIHLLTVWAMHKTADTIVNRWTPDRL